VENVCQLAHNPLHLPQPRSSFSPARARAKPQPFPLLPRASLAARHGCRSTTTPSPSLRPRPGPPWLSLVSQIARTPSPSPLSRPRAERHGRRQLHCRRPPPHAEHSSPVLLCPNRGRGELPRIPLNHPSPFTDLQRPHPRWKASYSTASTIAPPPASSRPSPAPTPAANRS
jgi:hypothetical protein